MVCWLNDTSILQEFSYAEITVLYSATATATWSGSAWIHSYGSFSRTNMSCGVLASRLALILKTSCLDCTQGHATLQHDLPRFHSHSYQHRRLTSMMQYFKVVVIFCPFPICHRFMFCLGFLWLFLVAYFEFGCNQISWKDLCPK